MTMHFNETYCVMSLDINSYKFSTSFKYLILMCLFVLLMFYEVYVDGFNGKKIITIEKKGKCIFKNKNFTQMFFITFISG